MRETPDFTQPEFDCELFQNMRFPAREEPHVYKAEPKHDAVEHPRHYTLHPSGVECIQITEHMNFCLGNAMKYIWRASLKNGTEDLRKAIFYLNREIIRLEPPRT